MCGIRRRGDRDEREREREREKRERERRKRQTDRQIDRERRDLGQSKYL